MMKYLLLLLIPVMAFSFGCGKPTMIGTPIEKARLDEIVPGTTGEAKIVEMFGQPEKKEMVGGGMVKYVYSGYYEEFRFWRKNIQKKSILEVFAKDGVVQKYDLKQQAIDPQSAGMR